MSILERLDPKVLRCLVSEDRKTCWVHEAGDYYSRDILNRAEMFQFAEEIKAIAESMVD